MQKLSKSIKIFQSYDHKCTTAFLWFTCMSAYVDVRRVWTCWSTNCVTVWDTFVSLWYGNRLRCMSVVQWRRQDLAQGGTNQGDETETQKASIACGWFRSAPHSSAVTGWGIQHNIPFWSALWLVYLLLNSITGVFNVISNYRCGKNSWGSFLWGIHPKHVWMW